MFLPGHGPEPASLASSAPVEPISPPWFPYHCSAAAKIILSVIPQNTSTSTLPGEKLVFKAPLHLSPGIPLRDGPPFIISPLSFGQSQLDLYKAILEIET